jgi:hypothetical protein
MEKNSGSKATRLGPILVAGCLGLLSSVGACAQPPSGAGAKAQSPCNQGVCKAVVTVQSCEKGEMTVVPDPIDVPAPNNIQWTIETPGYEFTKDGIVVKGNGFTPKPGLTGNGKKFIVHDDHTDKRKMIKYVVKVKRQSDGVVCKEYDPFINN